MFGIFERRFLEPCWDAFARSEDVLIRDKLNARQVVSVLHETQGSTTQA